MNNKKMITKQTPALLPVFQCYENQPVEAHFDKTVEHHTRHEPEKFS